MKHFSILSLLFSVLFLFGSSCTTQEVQPEVPADGLSTSVNSNGKDISNARRGKQQKALVKTISGTINGESFSAEMLIHQFVREGGNTLETGQIYAIASLTNISGNNLPSNVNDLVGETFKVPVGFDQNQNGAFSSLGNLNVLQAQVGGGRQGGTCPVLFLELGPIFLDLLGLVVEVPDPIIIDIRAEQGPGNLLGNLLCAILGLLDGGGPLAGITALLNRVLDIIGTLV
jgi:hypothetical protein